MIKPRNRGVSFYEYSDPRYSELLSYLERVPNFFRYVDLVNQLAYREGFTFYTGSYYRAIRVDPIPRLLKRDELEDVSKGLRQRATAINKFLYSVYHGEDTPVPKDLVHSSPYFRPEMMYFDPPKGVYVHVMGEDVVKVGGVPYILEDNVRVPSGMSYALKADKLVERVIGHFIPMKRERPDGLEMLKRTLEYASDTRDPVVAILTDGTLNSAYFEHRFYSERLDLLLVEPSDIAVKEKEVVAKTTEGEVHLDVVYRRIEDLDILTPGLMKAYLRGWVSIVNAPGTGVADDKVTFCFMPQIMEQYGLKEVGVRQPFSIPLGTSFEKVKGSMERLVLKRREGYGGGETFVLKEMGEEERSKVVREAMSYPEDFMAQELLDFDTVLSAINDGFYETYADLRFFVFLGDTSNVVLSRVAPVGTRVTNNSSGGLVKPVWVY